MDCLCWYRNAPATRPIHSMLKSSFRPVPRANRHSPRKDSIFVWTMARFRDSVRFLVKLMSVVSAKKQGRESRCKGGKKGSDGGFILYFWQCRRQARSGRNAPTARQKPGPPAAETGPPPPIGTVAPVRCRDR